MFFLMKRWLADLLWHLLWVGRVFSWVCYCCIGVLWIACWFWPSFISVWSLRFLAVSLWSTYCTSLMIDAFYFYMDGQCPSRSVMAGSLWCWYDCEWKLLQRHSTICRTRTYESRDVSPFHLDSAYFFSGLALVFVLVGFVCFFCFVCSLLD